MVLAGSDTLAASPAIPSEELFDATWLAPVGFDVAEQFCQSDFAAGREPKISHRGSHVEHLQHMAAAGLGMMLFPEHMSYPSGLVARPIVGDPVRRQVELPVVAGRRYSPALEAFVKVARVDEWGACQATASEAKREELKGGGSSTEQRSAPQNLLTAT